MGGNRSNTLDVGPLINSAASTPSSRFPCRTNRISELFLLDTNQPAQIDRVWETILPLPYYALGPVLFDFSRSKSESE